MSLIEKLVNLNGEKVGLIIKGKKNDNNIVVFGILNVRNVSSIYKFCPKKPIIAVWLTIGGVDHYCPFKSILDVEIM